jgi:hypothetical protein
MQLGRKRLLSIAATTTLAGIGSTAAVVTAGGSASAGTVPTEEERFTDYRQPAGPEMTPQDAIERGVQLALLGEPGASPLARTLASGSTTVETARGNLATVRALEAGEPASSALTTGSDPEQTELVRSSVYLVTLQGQFTPAVSVPRGTTVLPHGNTLALTIDAHTGFRIGLQVGPTVPDVSDLGPVTKLTIGTGSGGAIAATRLQGGLLFGNAYMAGKPAAGARIVVTGSAKRSLKRSRASRLGGFAFQLAAGTYTVSVLSAGGKACATKSEKIRRHVNTYVSLRCR